MLAIRWIYHALYISSLFNPIHQEKFGSFYVATSVREYPIKVEGFLANKLSSVPALAI